MDQLNRSLARIEGQVKALSRMHLAGKPGLDIVQQIMAARAALGRIGRELLKAEACQCMVDEGDKKKFDRILKQLFKS